MFWIPPALTAPESTPTDRLAAIIELLCESVIVQGQSGNMATALIRLIFFRFDRMGHRFARLMARILAGKPSRPAAPRPANPRPRPVKPPTDYRMPIGFGWLGHHFPGLMTGVGIAKAELEHLLNDPAIPGIIAADPKIARFLRPLCHALGVKRPPMLQTPAQAEPAPKRPRTRRPAADVRSRYDHPTPMAPGNRFWPPWNKPENSAA